MDWVTSVATDKFGNILALAGFPPRVDRLKYDESSGNMSFLYSITLQSVQEVTDICMDDNFSPDNQSDDTFWLTDIKGNAIFNLTLDGNFPTGRTGIYTRVINAAGNEIIFNKPTRIVANYGTHAEGQDRNLAIIDSDKKRITIIDKIINDDNNITGFQGNTIYAEYTVVNFTGQTNVSLNAIGYTPSSWTQTANGLWVADPNNGMFHIFDGGDMHSGYLGSVKSLNINGTPEWSSPKSLISTAMSNSVTDIPAFVTMDTYDDTHGINTYYPGADMVNIVASPNSISGEVDITASFINYSIIQSINIYNSGGTLVYSLPQFNYYHKDRESARGFVCSINPSHVGNLLGAYKASFTFVSGYNDYYESAYQKTVIRDVRFAMPLAGSFTGPLWGMSGTNYTWQTNMTSGSGDFTYTWSKQDDGSNVWQPISSSAWKKTILQMGGTSFTLKCDVTDNFNGQIKSFTQHISSGKLVANESWFGYNVITGPITVPAGITLTIYKGVTQPFTILFFTDNASLTVNGTLNVIGTSTDQITFDRLGTTGKWGPFKFDGSGASSSVLDNAVIKNATNIQILNNANVTIKNSTIKDCTQGVYVYNASPQILNNQILNPTQHGIYVDASGKSPLILDNVITKTSDRTADYKHQEGIIMYNGTVGYIAHNDITGFDHGIYVGGGSIAKFTNYTWQNYYPNNRLTGNRYGVMVGWGSTLLGGDGTNSCWNNNISNNDSYNAFIYQSSWAIAQNNYWGVRFFKQYVDASSNFYALPSLTSDPWISTGGGGSQSIIAANSEFPELHPSSSNVKSVFTSKELSKQFPKDELNNDRGAAKNEDELLTEINLEKEGKIDEAVEHLKKMVKNKKYSLYAITTLGGLKERYRKDDLQTYFEDLLKDPNEGNKSRIKKHLAGFYLSKDEDDKASALFDELKDDKRSKKDNFEGLYEKFNYMIHKKKDVVLAKNLFDEMKNKFADDEEANIHIATAEMLMSNINNNHAFGKKQNETAVSTDEVIKEYALSNNYPNPFNPVTTITYQLPKSGSVTLKIFDILGNEVRTLVNENKEMGRYTVQFDASSLASGMYVYQLRVNDYTSTKKMMLLK